MVPLKKLAFLFLMLSLPDAGSTCPSELNPLILEPAKITAEYGYLLSVNCTSTFEDPFEISWKVGDEIGEKEEWYSVSHNLSLTDWNMTAQCKIKINDSLECTKDLEITVYKHPEVFLFTRYVSAAGNETKYELQCDVINVAPVQNLTVRWYKNNETIKIDSFNSTTKTPVNESSILLVNISREEHVAQFTCEAQLDFGPHKGHISAFQTNISALYAPELNTKNDNEDIYISESDSVTLNCDAVGNPPPVFDWTCDGVNMSHSTKYLTLASVNVSTNCICKAMNYLGNKTKDIYVHVINPTVTVAPAVTPSPKSLLPRDCSVSMTPPELVVRFGDPALVTCNTSATDVAGMDWEATVNGSGFALSSSVTWMVEKMENWDVQASCFVTLNDGHKCNTALPITLYKNPDRVSVSRLDHGPIIEGQYYKLKCDVINVAPAENLKVIWYRGNKKVHTDIIKKAGVTPVNVSSTLNITADRDTLQHHRCAAELQLGRSGPEILPTVFSTPYFTFVYYAPLIKSCPSQLTVLEDGFSMDKCDCETDGNPTPMLRWYYKDKLINSSKPLSRNDSGMYIVEAENYLGKTNTSVHVTVEYGPLFTCDEHYEVKMNDRIQTTCEPGGLPLPLLTWFKDGKEVVLWTKHDSGKYVLKANNTHGTAEHTLYLDILYAPEFKEGNSHIEVTQGENVTLDCNAEGNPPPEIQWKFLSSEKETTVWRQKIVSVTGATSTSAGVYSCDATNKVGSVTRSVTLVIKGKSAGIPRAVIWGFLILLVILIILTLVAFFRNRQKKQGQYDFVPGNASSDILLSTRSAGVYP